MEKKPPAIIARPSYAQTALAVTLLAVGLFRIAGSFTGIAWLERVAATLAISPAPHPYVWLSEADPEVLDLGLAIRCEEKGEAKPAPWIGWNYRLRAAISGPHRRGVVLLHYFSLFGLKHRSPSEQEIFEAMSRYYFCGGGPVARAAGCSDQAEAVNLRYIGDSGFDQDKTERIACGTS